MAREEKVVARMTAEMKEKIQEIAEDRGITMSALVAYVLGSYVEQEEFKKKLAQQALTNLVPEISNMVKNQTDIKA
jgi:antitoxin component of RelBE/YafQ-DinJ toxin-antitoxin module